MNMNTLLLFNFYNVLIAANFTNESFRNVNEVLVTRLLHGISLTYCDDISSMTLN